MLSIDNLSKKDLGTRIGLYESLIHMVDKQLEIHYQEIERLSKQRRGYRIQIEAHKYFIPIKSRRKL